MFLKIFFGGGVGSGFEEGNHETHGKARKYNHLKVTPYTPEK
jgi:hypothetical protein